MKDKVIKTIEKYNMILPNEGIVVGLSGGPDSVCLLHILNSIRELYNINIYAVHINHMIRGLEADRDEAFAKNFAEALNIPFYCKRIKVEEYAKENNMSVEEAGRFLRYRFFNEIADKVSASKIALAHNMNDQAETMLMYFMRGSGLAGISGIKPVREGRYIRPIIELKRKEIEEYCRRNNLNPVTDSTNKESLYTRNKIRLELLPYIAENFNSNVIESLGRASDVFREEDDYLNEIAKGHIEIIRKKDGWEIESFLKLNKVMKRRVLRIILEKAKGNLKNVEYKHIEECIDLIKSNNTGKRLNLPGNIICEIEYDIFKVYKFQEKAEFEYNLLIPGETFIGEAGIKVCAQIINNEENKNFCDKVFIKYFDYDKIISDLKIRSKNEGDFIYPKGMNGRKKIKDVFIDKKIPRERRKLIPLIAMNKEILCAVGIRDTKNYKVNSLTKRVLELRIIREEKINE